MRIVPILLCALALMAAEPAGYKYWSASELKGMEKTLAGKLAGKNFASERTGEFGNHYTMVAHREGNGEAEFHENDADLFVVERDCTQGERRFAQTDERGRAGEMHRLAL